MMRSVRLLAVAASALCFANASKDTPLVRQLIHGGSPFIHQEDYKEEAHAGDAEEQEALEEESRQEAAGVEAAAVTAPAKAPKEETAKAQRPLKAPRVPRAPNKVFAKGL